MDSDASFVALIAALGRVYSTAYAASVIHTATGAFTNPETANANGSNAVAHFLQTLQAHKFIVELKAH